MEREQPTLLKWEMIRNWSTNIVDKNCCLRSIDLWKFGGLVPIVMKRVVFRVYNSKFYQEMVGSISMISIITYPFINNFVEVLGTNCICSQKTYYIDYHFQCI